MSASLGLQLVHEYPAQAVDVSSFDDMVRRFHDPAMEAVRRCFDVTAEDAVPMCLNDEGLKWAVERFGVADRGVIERQRVFYIDDRYLKTQSIFNPLRSLRSGGAIHGGPPPPIEKGLCDWCRHDKWRVSKPGLFADEFGEVVTDDGRFRARANWARLASVGGIVFGDEHAHNLFDLSKKDFVALFAAAEEYISRAEKSIRAPMYFICFLNGGPKAAGSVEHAHLQIAGRSGRHFGYADLVAELGPHDYWLQMRAAHTSVGLDFAIGPCLGWANLCAVRNRDLTIMAPDLRESAGFVHALLQHLIANGTTSFSLAAILAPPHDPRFRLWPPVLWRVADRGDAGVTHCDIGSLELLGGASVFSSDPWALSSGFRSRPA